MIGYHSIFTDEVSSDFDMYKRTKIAKLWNFKDSMSEAHHDDQNDPQPTEWNLEDGYLNDREEIQPIRALKMQHLKIGTSSVANETLCEGRTKIFKIILHLPNEVPQLSYEAIDYRIGKDQVILISAEVIKYEDSLKDFPPETRGCYFDGERKLQFFKSYTKSNCEYECFSNYSYLMCGCVKFSMVHNDKMNVCTVERGCLENFIYKFPRSYYENPENKRRYPHYPCGCLPSCTEIKYQVIKQIDNEDDHR
jgi:amiloride-sensitive sodium channel